MTNGLRRLTIAAGFLLLAGSSVRTLQAQAAPLVRFGLGGGVSVPIGNTKDAFANGINGQAYMLFNANSRVPFRINFGYQKFDFHEALMQAGESSIFSGIAGVAVNVIKAGPLATYVTAGVGAFGVRQEVDGTTDASSRSRFGLDGGAGLTLTFGRLSAFAEGRVQNIFGESGLIETSSIRAIPVTFGVMF